MGGLQASKLWQKWSPLTSIIEVNFGYVKKPPTEEGHEVEEGVILWDDLQNEGDEVTIVNTTRVVIKLLVAMVEQ
jgi:hypothetical protein